MAISDKYYNYFNQGLTFEKISRLMGVKKTTVFNHFVNYMYKNDISHYNNFIKKQLPNRYKCIEIIRRAYKGNSIGSIRYNIDDVNIDYMHIKLVLHLDNKSVLGKLIKIPDRHYRGPGWYEEKNEIEEIKKEDLFSFLIYKDRFRLKIAIGEYLSHTAVKWVEEGKIIDINILNNIDRKEIAKEFLIDDGYHRLSSYKYTFDPTEKRLVEDIAKQIDYKIPKNYYIKKKDLDFGYQDHTISVRDYRGIENAPGLKYKYVENYIRDDLAYKGEDLNQIDLHEDIIPFVNQELKEYGYTFKENIDINEDVCLMIMHFLRDDDNKDQVMEYIVYE